VVYAILKGACSSASASVLHAGGQLAKFEALPIIPALLCGVAPAQCGRLRSATAHAPARASVRDEPDSAARSAVCCAVKSMRGGRHDIERCRGSIECPSSAHRMLIECSSSAHRVLIRPVAARHRVWRSGQSVRDYLVLWAIPVRYPCDILGQLTASHEPQELPPAALRLCSNGSWTARYLCSRSASSNASLLKCAGR
jgi:hypothetical protein